MIGLIILIIAGIITWAVSTSDARATKISQSPTVRTVHISEVRIGDKVCSLDAFRTFGEPRGVVRSVHETEDAHYIQVGHKWHRFYKEYRGMIQVDRGHSSNYYQGPLPPPPTSSSSYYRGES